ncbi:MAG: Crp/Fnr family transcriptional regulator [Betaproteobacteria bacterium]|nr:Crp/Fnr family transcriptional regulator [Betaproteobacteria bacterium]
MSAANGRILRLVKNGPEREALESGQVDAVLDHASGTALLLPEAERALSSPAGEAANHLLAALPRRDYERLLAELELVALTYGEVLYEPGARIRYVYFPNDAIVSLLVVVEHKALEVTLVGREGLVGIPLALGADLAPVRALVQGTGSALRMKAASFREELERCVPLQREIYRYAYAKLVQARQTAACNRFHQVDQRLARWLLITHDRVRGNRVHLTHEFLADMLGVRRVGVTTAAAELQRQGLIEYHRGDIRILDRRRLETAACSCYRLDEAFAG